MSTDPVEDNVECADGGADIITVHAEANGSPEEIIEKIHSRGIKAGVSVKP